ncbi:hypothetical protein LIT25_07845 [Bacillus sp. F19]|nr:hypothetical protein LIT25_07845 [Bacillus sp. F19]
MLPPDESQQAEKLDEVIKQNTLIRMEQELIDIPLKGGVNVRRINTFFIEYIQVSNAILIG